MKPVRTLQDILDAARSARPRRIAVAAAADAEVLDAVSLARKSRLAEFVLVGDRGRILELAEQVEADLSGVEILDEPDPAVSAVRAVRIVAEGKADIVMKGLLETSVFMKAVLAEKSLRREGRIISSMPFVEIPELGRLLFLSDPGFIPLPDLETKKKIVQNAVEVLVRLGIGEPKVAMLCAAETVSPKIPSTVEAREIEEMNRRGEIPGCVVAGPISMDLAVSEKAAEHKGYRHPVAGKADLLVVPSIEVGNVLYKTLTCIGKFRSGIAVMGARVPIVFTSRADSADTKLNTIALAVYLAGEE